MNEIFDVKEEKIVMGERSLDCNRSERGIRFIDAGGNFI